jgi:hypothetical protein
MNQRTRAPEQAASAGKAPDAPAQAAPPASASTAQAQPTIRQSQAHPARADQYHGRGGLYTVQGGRRVRVTAVSPTATQKEPQP